MTRHLKKKKKKKKKDSLFFVVFCTEAKLYPRKKNEKSRDNTPARYHHRRHCIHYINIFTTKRKESTDKKNNKNKNKNNTLNYSNATSVAFRNSVVVFFSKRVVQLQRQKREQL